MSEISIIVQKLVHLMIQKNMTLSTAESCTGGLLAKLITDVSGSSQIFSGGIVSYSNTMKIKWLGVSEETLIKHGAVSEETVREMLGGIQQSTGSNLALAVSGIAGPTGGTPEKPVGTVIIGQSVGDNLQVVRYLFEGNREEIREKTAFTAFQALLDALKDDC
ncbi:CinA family protein [candidate division KSB1 bacterium]|nr:CinA family protein [candidate division KSB1 bacterium]